MYRVIFILVVLISVGAEAVHAQQSIRDFDGYTYRVKQIGEQVWMVENLKSIHDAEGIKIKRVCYDLVRENCDKYGGLYAWDELRVDEASDSLQGICPEGWHIPTDHDWSLLIENLGGADSAAYFMKKDTSLFDIQYAGNYHYRLINYNYLDRIAYYWTASSYSSTAAWMRMIGKRNINTNRSTVPKAYCLSVRCIKD